MDFPQSFDKMVAAMLKCEQTKGQSVYQHGSSVRMHFYDLLQDNCLNQKIPDWFFQYKEEIISSLYDKEIVELYLQFHDCGKPFCRIEKDDKIHFPNHAQVSREIWLKVDGNPIIANLIGWDMDIHTMSAVDIKKRCSEIWNERDACTLLTAALAELNSNAKLFGGTDTTSFKSKFKQIDRRGKQICKFLFERRNHVSPVGI